MPAHEWMQARGQNHNTGASDQGSTPAQHYAYHLWDYYLLLHNYYSVSVRLCIQLQVGSNICTARLSTKNATQMHVWTNA